MSAWRESLAAQESQSGSVPERGGIGRRVLVGSPECVVLLLHPANG